MTIETKIAKNGSKRYYVRDDNGKLSQISREKAYELQIEADNKIMADIFEQVAEKEMVDIEQTNYIAHVDIETVKSPTVHIKYAISLDTAAKFIRLCGEAFGERLIGAYIRDTSNNKINVETTTETANTNTEKKLYKVFQANHDDEPQETATKLDIIIDTKRVNVSMNVNRKTLKSAYNVFTTALEQAVADGVISDKAAQFGYFADDINDIDFGGKDYFEAHDSLDNSFAYGIDDNGYNFYFWFWTTTDNGEGDNNDAETENGNTEAEAEVNTATDTAADTEAEAEIVETANIEGETETTPEYKYYIKSRRPIFGAAPNGYIKAVSGEVHEPVRRPNGTYSPKCRIYFATVIYDKPLTNEQITNYDLAVSNETFELLNATNDEAETPINEAPNASEVARFQKGKTYRYYDVDTGEPLWYITIDKRTNTSVTVSGEKFKIFIQNHDRFLNYDKPTESFIRGNYRIDAADACEESADEITPATLQKFIEAKKEVSYWRNSNGARIWQIAYIRYGVNDGIVGQTPWLNHTMKEADRYLKDEYGMTLLEYLAAEDKWNATDKGAILKDKIERDSKPSIEELPALFPAEDNDDDDELIDPPDVTTEKSISKSATTTNATVKAIADFCENVNAAAPYGWQIEFDGKNFPIEFNGKLVTTLDSLALAKALPPERFFEQFAPDVSPKERYINDRHKELDMLLDFRKFVEDDPDRLNTLANLIEDVKREILNAELDTEHPPDIEYDEHGDVIPWF